MADTHFQRLSVEDRRYALRVVQDKSRRRAFLLEKDLWMVAALGVLFNAPFAGQLIFKGGTSLSKVWRAIRRFSEDVDITYDIRAFAPDLVAGTGEEALPPTRSQERRWSRAIRARLAEWVREHVCPLVQDELGRAGFDAAIRPDGERIHIRYEPLFEQTGLIRPEVMIEFGARSTGEPHKHMPVVCDMAEHLSEFTFPEARPSVMLAERTFWEKATAVHVFCHQQRQRGERQSRHWHDLARLDEAGFAERALADRELGLSVARHKSVFFSEKDVQGNRIDYAAAVSGQLQLIPSGAAHAMLADDYASMLADGMLPDEEESFDSLMERCAAIEAQANVLVA